MAKTKHHQEAEWASMLDRLPEEERAMQNIRQMSDTIGRFYGFERIHLSLLEDPRTFGPLMRTGFFEDHPPFVAKTALGSDVMLKPSGALSLFRAYVTQKMNDLPHPLKFLFSGEVFFGSSRNSILPPRGTYEWGLCMIGEEGPIAEAEVIQVFWKTYEALGFDHSSLSMRVNATSCNECRNSFRGALGSYFRPKIHKFCKNCKRYLKSNPTKILSCKEEKCRMISQNAPQVLDYLCEICKRHLRGVLEFLDEMKIPYYLDSKFFKEASFYSSLIFEISLSLQAKVPEDPPQEVIPDKPEIQEAGADKKEEKAEEPAPSPEEKVGKEDIVIAEGGRMSRAAEAVAGKKLDVVCGTMRLDAFARTLLKKEKISRSSECPNVFLAQLGELAKRKSLSLLEELRAGGISVQESLGRDSVKSQLKVAERSGAQMALILGQKEAIDQTIIVREIQSGIQETVPQEKLVDFLRKKLK